MVSSIGSQSASSWASSLFSKIDTKNQGYIEKSDLQAAFAKIDKTGDASTDVDAVFKQLDGDSDGKVTKAEMSSALEKLAGELNAQFDQSRVRGGMKGGGGMPPPPPGGAGPAQGSGGASETANTDASYIAAAETNGDGTVSAEELAAYQVSDETSSTTAAASGSEQESMIPAFGSMPPPQMHGAQDTGFTKDELLEQLDELGAYDSRRSSLISSLVENFDAADTDGDGRINRMEARSHDKSSRSGEVSAQDGSTMMNMMQLLRAYSFDNESARTGASTLSVTA